MKTEELVPWKRKEEFGRLFQSHWHKENEFEDILLFYR